MPAISLPRRFGRDERGSLTVEFVIWVPILALWLVVSAAFFDAYKSRYDAVKAAQTISDIVSRQIEVDADFVTGLYLLQDSLLPRAPAGTKLRVTSIQYYELTDSYHVIWSNSMGGRPAMTDEEIPVDLLPQMADLDSVVLTELSVPFEPFSSWANITASSWDFELVARPRFVSSVAMIEPCPGSSSGGGKSCVNNGGGAGGGGSSSSTSSSTTTSSTTTVSTTTSAASATTSATTGATTSGL